MAEGDHLGVGDFGDDNHWAQLAKKHWPKPAKSKKTKPEVIRKEIWDVLEEEAFQFRSLLMLENLQLLEKYANHDTIGIRCLPVISYLWPGYTGASTNHHVLLIALITTVKRRENLPVWSKKLSRDTKWAMKWLIVLRCFCG